jgi:DNA polymerase III delta prime subunit
MSSAEQGNLSKLRQKLNDHFDLSELHDLCFDLRVDPENLPAKTKQETIRELILQLARNKRLSALLLLVREQRSHIIWPDISPEEIAGLLHTPATSPLPVNAKASRKRRDQLILLEKVKNFWIDGVLDKVVTNKPIKLVRRRVDEMIENPWHKLLPTAVAPSGTTSDTIHTLFTQTNRALLILGAPGAGKTITLLELARDLIQLTEQDASQPIPIILNLSTWSESRRSLIDWATEELTAKYQIPRQIGRSWLETNDILLLMDGLDEIPLHYRDDCIRAINHFRDEHGLIGLLVCCRSQEYLEVGIRLKLGGAIQLQTLTPAQVDAHLAQAGPHLGTLRAAIHQDSVLCEMAASPLVLNIMSVAYSDMAPDQLTNLATNQTAHEHLFATYIGRMFRRRGQGDPQEQAQIKKWLAWLAHRMTEHNQTVFLVEQIQPSWAPTNGWRWFYVILSRLLGGWIIAVLLWGFTLLGEQNISGFHISVLDRIADILALSGPTRNLWALMILHSATGLIAGLIDGIFFAQRQRQGDEATIDKQRGLGQFFIVASVIGLLTVMAVILFGDPLLLGILAGTLAGVFFGFGFGYIEFGQSYRTEIRTVEAIGWSWVEALKGIVPGTIIGLIAGGSLWLLYQDIPISLTFLFATILLFCLRGAFRRHQIEAKIRPNQGIWLSIRNSLLAILLFSPVLGLFTGLILGVQSGLTVAIIVGLIAGLWYGGIDVFKHSGLRIGLWVLGHMPLRYVRFLDHAARLNLLHKVGGGYIFIHRSLQEYFAPLDP